VLHGEEARVEAPIFEQMRSTWLPTVFGEITSFSAISLFERPRASSLNTSTSRSGRPNPPGDA
jgi:hypothetical protein